MSNAIPPQPPNSQAPPRQPKAGPDWIGIGVTVLLVLLILLVAVNDVMANWHYGPGPK